MCKCGHRKNKILADFTDGIAQDKERIQLFFPKEKDKMVQQYLLDMLEWFDKHNGDEDVFV